MPIPQDDAHSASLLHEADGRWGLQGRRAGSLGFIGRRGTDTENDAGDDDRFSMRDFLALQLQRDPVDHAEAGGVRPVSEQAIGTRPWDSSSPMRLKVRLALFNTCHTPLRWLPSMVAGCCTPA